MFVVEPAPLAPNEAAREPVHIDLDDSSSSGGESDDFTEEQQEAGADTVEDLIEAPEQQRRRSALTVETDAPAWSSRSHSPSHSHSPSPVSRLNGYITAVGTTATGGNTAALESTGSSRCEGRTRGRTINAAFFESLRKDRLTRTPPPKASLKRPLPLQIERRKVGPVVAVAEKKKPVQRNSNPHEYKSSSDSSDLDDEDVEVEEQETKQEEPDEDDDGDEDRGTTVPAAKKSKPDAPPPLNFFMSNSREPFATDLRSPDMLLHQRQHDHPQQRSQHNRISSSRTRICGQVYGRCELTFSDRSVELVLWRQGEPEKRIWQGTLKYTHLQRFCFYRGERLPPYLLLMEIRTSEEVNTLFSEFYDSIFAKFAQERMEVPKPNLYGAAFYFDEDVDFVRCQSMAESFPALNELFDVQIPKEEAVEYFDSEVNGGDGNRSSTRVMRGQQSSAAHATDQSNDGVVKSDKGRSDQSIAKFFRKGSQQTVVEIDDPSQASFGDESEEKKPSGGLEQRENGKDGAEMLTELQARDVATQALEAKRSTTLLTYPYEDSESAGKISVTYGDIARLAPGEFLNDNIIDFYLRFYWRHLEPWRQEQMYFYSSHFFTQLNGNGANLTAEERFARVSRWTQKEGDLFMKRFLFIPINDSFHWSVAVFCNPGSAIIQKRRRIRQVIVSKNGEISARRPISVDSDGEPMIVDLAVDNFSQFRENGDDDGDDRANGESAVGAGDNGARQDCDEVREEYYEEDLENHSKYRKEHPPCLLFLDSLKCHRKKKFTAMLRDYLDSEWKNRHGSDSDDSIPTGIDDESIAMYFEPESITLLEPDIPMQTNSSDCGVFLLMYAAEVARRFPAGITQEDFETKFAATLTSEMFDLSHVQEFRDYLHQLIFCLHSLQKRGLSEEYVKDEELDTFTIER